MIPICRKCKRTLEECQSWFDRKSPKGDSNPEWECAKDCELPKPLIADEKIIGAIEGENSERHGSL